MCDIVERLRAAAHDERLSTGALYAEAADLIEALIDGIEDLAVSFHSADWLPSQEQEREDAIEAGIEKLMALISDSEDRNHE